MSWPIPPGSNVENIGGYPLTYRSQGSGHPILFVHGAATDYRIWGSQLEHFAGRYKAIAVALRHYFPEPWDSAGGNLSIVRDAANLASLIRQMDIAPVHLVAHSRGGAVALQLASAHPDLIASMVLADASFGVRGREETTEAVKFIRKLLPPIARAVEQGDREKAAQLFADGLNGPGSWDAAPPPAKAMLIANIATVACDPADDQSFDAADTRTTHASDARHQRLSLVRCN